MACHLDSNDNHVVRLIHFLNNELIHAVRPGYHVYWDVSTFVGLWTRLQHVILILHVMPMVSVPTGHSVFSYSIKPQGEYSLQKSEISFCKSVIRNWLSEIGNRLSEIRNRLSEIGNQLSEISFWVGWVLLPPPFLEADGRQSIGEKSAFRNQLSEIRN